MSNSPISVRINPTTKINACASKESKRYALANVQIVPIIQDEVVSIGRNADGSQLTERRPTNEVYAIATDGQMMAVNRLHGMAVESAMCPAAMMKPEAAKLRNTVSLNGRWESTAGKMAELPEGRFPRVADVMPTSRTVTMAITPELLKRLADAISTSGIVNLIFDVDQDNLVTSSIGVIGDNGFGVIMPAESVTGTKDRYSCAVKEFQDNMVAENTEERKAAVLAILNPDMAPKETQPAAQESTPEATAAELAEKAHIELHDKIALRPSCGDVRLYPVGAQYRAYGKDASRIGEAIGMHWDVEYQGTDHELAMIAIPQECLTDYMGKFGMANVFIKLCEAL